jgi:hypothetical protein
MAPVVASNKFLTSQHPSSDMEHLNSVIASLEKEFNDRYDQVVNETFENKLKRYAALN